MDADRPAGRRAMDELKRMADDVCLLILHTDLPEVDIDIQIGRVRQRCGELFPDRLDLFDMIYGSRFRRLMEQWHRDAMLWRPPPDECELV